MCELWVVFMHLIVLSGRNKWPKIETFLFVLQIFANSIAINCDVNEFLSWTHYDPIDSIIFLVFEEVNNDSDFSKTLQLNGTKFHMSKLGFGLLRYWTIYLKHFFSLFFLNLKTTTSTKINLLSLPSQCKYTPKIELETRVSQSLEYVRSRRTSTLDSIQATSKKKRAHTVKTMLQHSTTKITKTHCDQARWTYYGLCMVLWLQVSRARNNEISQRRTKRLHIPNIGNGNDNGMNAKYDKPRSIWWMYACVLYPNIG